MSSTIPLSTNWSFKQHPSSSSCSTILVPEFLPARSLPTEIHLDLLAHNLIPDPFLKQNETAVQWIGEEQWVYHTAFRSPPTTSSARHVLVFEGLDTFATVKLNGTVILESDNMFLPHRIDVTSLLSSTNSLEILFDSAFIRGKKIREKYPDFKWGVWNGDSSRLAVRKAQYHYGWDWGPMLMTCGPWKHVYLETFETRVAELGFTVEVAEGLESARVAATAEVEGPGRKVVFKLIAPDEGVRTAVAEVGEDGIATAVFEVEQPELWFPHGYGRQPLYTLSAAVDEGSPVKKRLGIRKARAVQRELVDSEGKTFFFEVNNIPLWTGGSNWIPADSFLTRLDEGKYRRWLDLLRDGNQIMVRVWGGGIYEVDCFYDICDEYGILVWQDFAFGCGNYPAMIPEFRESVEKEAIANVKRLRHHPSIVIYAGNNEDYAYMMSQEYYLGYDPEDTNPQNWLITQFPARYIYEKILPEVVSMYSPGTEYHRGSPYGTPAQPGGADNKHGDMHQWNVWHGTQEPYQNFKNLSGRFVSEFGMEGFPALSTIKHFLADSPQTEHKPFSSTVEFHNKADGAERRIALYLSENLIPNITSLEGYVYSTQLLQSEALSAAYIAWRRLWKGPGREHNAGALVWQINDCWPVTSWAIIDYFYNPKLSYYAIKRALTPLAIAAERTVTKTPRDKYTSAHVDIEHKMQIWASNFTLSETDHLDLEIKAFDVTTGKCLDARRLNPIVLPPNRSTELSDRLVPGQDQDHPADRIVVALRLMKDERTVARFVSWPDPLKYLDLQKLPGVEVRTVREGVLSVSARKPVKGMELVAEGAEVVWADNGVDLVPGEEVEVRVSGLPPRGKVLARWYGCEVAVEVGVV